MECGADPDTVGAAPPEIGAISRMDTGCQRIVSSAASTCDWMSPQPVAGSRGISFWPFAPMSTTCGGITARAGQTVPGRCATDGWRRALTSAARLESDRCSVAVVHRPLPGMASTPFTHRSTLTGTKDTGSDTLVAPVGQPAQAGSPATTRPPLTVGTGVTDAEAAADEEEAAAAVACAGWRADRTAAMHAPAAGDQRPGGEQRHGGGQGLAASRDNPCGR